MCTFAGCIVDNPNYCGNRCDKTIGPPFLGFPDEDMGRTTGDLDTSKPPDLKNTPDLARNFDFARPADMAKPEMTCECASQCPATTANPQRTCMATNCCLDEYFAGLCNTTGQPACYERNYP